MDTTAWLLWGVVFGSIGLGYFLYGKKQGRALLLVCGIGLMVYPYFVASTLPMLAIGAVLVALPWVLRR